MLSTLAQRSCTLRPSRSANARMIFTLLVFNCCALLPQTVTAQQRPQQQNPAGDDGSKVSVTLTKSQLSSGIVKSELAIVQPFSSSITLTGKIALNEDRLAHIYPIVQGQAESVGVALGSTVNEGDIILTIRSRDVGTAKLELYQSNLQLELARLKLSLQEELAANTNELLAALRSMPDISEIQNQFMGRPMGDYRERLLQAYAALVKSESDVQRLVAVSESGAIAAKNLLLARASRNADAATFFARIEQVDYELKTTQLQAQQTVKEAETRVAVAATNLRIMGCELQDLKNINPLEQGNIVSEYFIRAPLSGTVIFKDVVLREQVRPETQIMSIADLSTVWIEANVYEKDVPLLRSLKDRNIIFRNAAWPDKQFEAKVFFTGEIMDEKTRTISMRAIAENPAKILKPGMFVTIEFASDNDNRPVIQVPNSSIMDHAGSKFVFVQVSETTFERRDVQTGTSNGTKTVIHSGLQAGDAVVVAGGFILKSKMLESLLGED